MSILESIVLGAIQGVTEFLPVSSSGHVLIVSKLLGSKSSFEFDVLVSFGTLFAVIIYYRKRLLGILMDIIKKRDMSLALKLIVATLPAAVLGFLLSDIIKKYFHGINTVIIMLLLVGVLMVISVKWLVNKSLPVNKDLHRIGYKQAIVIGLAQCASLVSGSSRSGTTMLAALKLGFSKSTAAEWSFLMSIPIIFGASMKVLLSNEGMLFIQQNRGAFILSNVVSFITGILAIHILLNILQKKGLYWFGWYRIGLAVLLITLLSVRIIT